MKPILKLLAACLLALPLFACASVSSSAASAATGDVNGRMGTMMDDLKGARPHSDPYGQGLIDSALSAGTQIQMKDLPVLLKAAAQLAADEVKIKVLNTEWISPRMRGLIYVVLGSLVGCCLIGGVLEAFAGESGFLFVAAGLFKAIGTFGLSMVSAVFKFITSKVVGASSAIAKMHEASQTLHAVAQNTQLAQAGITTGQPVIGVAVAVPSAGPGTKEMPIATS
jgi:hypothetical protein